MSISYSSVVPWGRNMNEYLKMFDLSKDDLSKKIIGFGDGPASFNFEMNKAGYSVISLDPIYQFSKEQIQKRIDATKDEVIEQVKNNMDLFVWNNFKSLEDLVDTRMKAMQNFLNDFENGKKQGRYKTHEFPASLSFTNRQFDLGLSSHFLFLYSELGIDFHINTISEMLRVCKEVRIFPILNLNAQKSELLDAVINSINNNFEYYIDKVDYEFQKRGNKMLRILNKN